MDPWINTPRLYWPNIQKGSIGTSPWTLNSTNIRYASLFQVPRTGRITGLRFYLKTVTTGQTIRCALQGVTSETMGPDGTDLTTGDVSVADTDDNALKEVTFSSGVNVVRGDWRAIVWRWASSSGDLEIRSCGDSIRTNVAHYYYASGFWFTESTGGAFCLTWSDGVRAMVQGVSPAFTTIAESITHDGTPDEVGNRFVLPFDAIADAVWFYYGNITNGNLRQVCLYDDSKQLAYMTTDDSNSPMGIECGELLLPTPLLLKAGRTYRVAMAPIINWPVSLTVYAKAFVDAAGLAAENGHWDCYRTERTNGGSWTDTATQRTFVGVRLSHVSSSGIAPVGWMPQGTILHEGPPIIMPGQG